MSFKFKGLEGFQEEILNYLNGKDWCLLTDIVNTVFKDIHITAALVTAEKRLEELCDRGLVRKSGKDKYMICIDHARRLEVRVEPQVVRYQNDPLSPTITAHHVLVEDDLGLLREMLARENEVEAFKRGCQAMASFSGVQLIFDPETFDYKQIYVAPKCEKVELQVGTKILGSPELDCFPEIEIYLVTVCDDNGEWQETFGCRNELNAFVRGCKAVCSFAEVRLEITPEFER
ncbi:hypothetical protein HQ571_00980 [Candidatus Kuenenbacteria bacterium]|nr:hypothetical protein [Candidatus Kuenenbacteria bacterium]